MTQTVTDAAFAAQMEAAVKRYMTDFANIPWSASVGVTTNPDGSKTFTLPAPGIRKEDVQVVVSSGMVVVTGKTQKPVPGQNPGRFVDRFALPTGTDGRDVKAVVDGGLVVVTIPPPTGRSVPVE